jgi:hypothetical protein
MALLPGSPALAAGDTASAPPTDQRGLPRIVNGKIDIGALETQELKSLPLHFVLSAYVVLMQAANSATLGDPILACDPQPAASQLILPGPGMTGNGMEHLKGHVAQMLTEGTESMNVVINYELDGSVQAAVVPLSLAVALGSVTAVGTMSGTLTEAVFMQGATAPSWLIKAQIGMAWNLSGVVHPPQPVPGSPVMSQEIDATFGMKTMLSQTETPASGGQAWMVQTTVDTNGSLSELCHPPDPCMESLSVHDQIHESRALMTEASPGPVTMIDAVFAGTGSLSDAFVPPSPAPQSNPLVLAGTSRFSGQLTIAAPPATSGPAPAPMTFDLTGDGVFDEAALF